MQNVAIPALDFESMYGRTYRSTSGITDRQFLRFSGLEVGGVYS